MGHSSSVDVCVPVDTADRAGPLRAASAYEPFKRKEYRFLASGYEMFSLALRESISFSCFHKRQVREYAGWGSLQFGHLSGLSHTSATCSVLPHFAHVSLPRQLREPWPYRWHLKHLCGLGT